MERWFDFPHSKATFVKPLYRSVENTFTELNEYTYNKINPSEPVRVIR